MCQALQHLHPGTASSCLDEAPADERLGFVGVLDADGHHGFRGFRPPALGHRDHGNGASAGDAGDDRPCHQAMKRALPAMLQHQHRAAGGAVDQVDDEPAAIDPLSRHGHLTVDELAGPGDALSHGRIGRFEGALQHTGVGLGSGDPEDMDQMQRAVGAAGLVRGEGQRRFGSVERDADDDGAGRRALVVLAVHDCSLDRDPTR